MTKYSTGPKVQANARRLLEDLILLAEAKEKPSWRNKAKKPLTVKLTQNSLIVTFTISALVKLIENDRYNNKLNSNSVESSIKFLKNFLGILKLPQNQQGQTQQGTIELWHNELNENLEQFDRECAEKRREKNTTKSASWKQVKNRIPSEFDLLDREFFEERKGEVKILKLHSATWSLITEGHYIKRDSQKETLEVARKLSSCRSISFLIIRGIPGAGKTALMRWLVYQLYNEGHVVLQKNQEVQNCIRTLKKFSQVYNIDNKTQHFYLLTEELFRDKSLVDELQKEEFSFPLTIISTTRLNEDRQKRLSKYPNIEKIDLKLLDVEKNRIVDSIKEKYPEAKARLAEKTDLELSKLKENSSSMLVLMLELSEGKPFDLIIADIIKRLFDKKDSPLYKVFGLICSSYQYNVVVYPEVFSLCLPECTLEAINLAIDNDIERQLKGIVHKTVGNRNDFEGFATVHELIAETAIKEAKDHYEHEDYKPYPTNLLEIHLEKVIPRLDAQQEPNIRWFIHILRALSDRSPENLDIVHKLLNRYSENIKLLQHNTTITRWASWANMYAAAGLKSEEERCINALIATKPQDSMENDRKLSEIARKSSPEAIKQLIKESTTSFEQYPDDFHLCPKFFKLVEDYGNPQQKRKTIIFATYWLKQHDDDNNVRSNYLSFVKKFGTRPQKKDAIDTTFKWLKDHRNDTSVRARYLGLVEKCGTNEHKQDTFSDTTEWLDEHPDNFNIRQKYLSFIRKWETNTQKKIRDIVNDNNILEIYLALEQKWKIDDRQQKKNEIVYAADWLELAPNDIDARVKYLSLIQQSGIEEKIKETIDDTAQWLKDHLDDTAVRVKYLSLIQQCGTDKHKQKAINDTTKWLDEHLDDTTVRTKYLALIGKESELLKDIKTIDIKTIIDKQWQWIKKQNKVEQSSLATFLSIVAHQAKDNIELIKQTSQLALKQYPKDFAIARAVFLFQDYLKFEVCYELADFIANSKLPKDKWYYQVRAANFFRDYGDLDRAEIIYTKVIKSEKRNKKKVRASFASLEYARFLIIKESSKWNEAVEYLKPILRENQKHCLANLYMAQCYLAKALSQDKPTYNYWETVIKFYQKAIRYDIHKNGKYWYELGNFYKQIMGKKEEAYICFIKSLKQKDNLPACIALAELELEAGNKNDAKEYIERGLKIELITRPEREEKKTVDDKN